MPTVRELGESGVLARVLACFSEADAALVGPGDDCAVLRSGGDTVVTTDTMIEGPDFRLAWHRPFDLGWKLAATNLSDVAAMGARPTALTVAFAVPGDAPVDLLEGIAGGLDAACRQLAPGCAVVGGDLGRSEAVMASVTALGDLEGRPPVLRSGARPGDAVAYAGPLGLAGLGLSLLFAEAADSDGTALGGAPLESLWRRHPEALAAQLAPTPPISLGAVAARSGASAMMDVSDSLSIDAARLARASEAVVDLDSSLLVRAFGEQHGVRVPLEAMLTGGEDHGLLATFPPGAALPAGFERIGTIAAARPAARPEAALSAAAMREGAVPARPAPASDPPLLRLDASPYEPSGWDPYTVRLPGA